MDSVSWVTKTQDKIGHALYNRLFSLVPTDILDEGKNVALKNQVEPLTSKPKSFVF